jgi:hypothetical protein
MTHVLTITWDDVVDELITGDLTGALGYRTPAGGVVVQAVAPIGLRDRERGRIGFTTSLGFSKKLERIALDRRVCVAFHAREHGTARGTVYALIQGEATVVERPSGAERALISEQATTYLGEGRTGPFWDRWLREYYRSRVPVWIDADRIVTWPTLDCAGPALATGEQLPSSPPDPQSPPRNGTGPRIDVARAAKRLRGTAHTLLGFAGADARPVVLPVTVAADDASGLVLSAAWRPPPGSRRAGMLGHSYRPGLVGLRTRQYTGWLTVGDDGEIRYAPHTETGYVAPPNKTLLLLLNGALAKRGTRAAARRPVVQR